MTVILKEKCFICETDPNIIRELDPADRCSTCNSKYTALEIKGLLLTFRRLQDHPNSSESAIKRFAEGQIVAEKLREMTDSGELREIEVNALVNHVMLHQTQEDVGFATETHPRTIMRATKSGLQKLANALNRQKTQT